MMYAPVPGQAAVIYATDEDVAVRASADYAVLCPKDQKLAWGVDGVFLASDPWTLKSGSVDFLARGVRPGHVVQLVHPASAFKAPGESLAVDAVVRNAVSLRRKGQGPRLGQPPAPEAGLNQVEFLVTSLGPQVARASEDLDRRYGIDDLLSGRRRVDLFDPREVRDLVVLTVLYRQYTDMSRGGADGRTDTFAAKAQVYRQELDDLLARTVVRWSDSTGLPGSEEATTRFCTRVSR